MKISVDLNYVKSKISKNIILRKQKFDLNKSGLIWIKGLNGAGKSILASVISGKAYLDESDLDISATIVLEDSNGNQFRLSNSNDVEKYSSRVSFLTQEIGSSLIAIHHQDDICFGLEGRFPDLPGSSTKEKDEVASNRIEELSGALNLWSHLKKKIGQSSYGETRRIEFACTISPHSELVILDEPFSGLDGFWTAQLSKILNSYPKAYESIWIITSNKSPDQFGISPDKIIELEFSKENLKAFECIKDKIDELYANNRIQLDAGLSIKDLYIERPKFEIPIELKKFHAPPGEVTWLIGDNGSGKTTIAQVLSGILYSSRFYGIKVDGEINGLPINKIIHKAPNEEIKYLHQNPYSSYVYRTMSEDLKKKSFLSQTTNITSLNRILESQWGKLSRNARAFSFGQLKFLQLLLLPLKTEVVFIDEPLLGLNPILYPLMLDCLNIVADSGRTVISTCESGLFDFYSGYSYLNLASRK